MNGSLNKTYYSKTSANGGYATTVNSYQNGFVLGLNLDTLRGQSTTQNSGISLANVTTYWEGYITTAPHSDLTVDTFLLHDVLYVIASDGSCSVRW